MDVKFPLNNKRFNNLFGQKSHISFLESGGFAELFFQIYIGYFWIDLYFIVFLFFSFNLEISKIFTIYNFDF